MRINCEISSDLDNLEKYKQVYKWIPGKDNIRPSEDIIIKKNAFFNDIQLKYNSISDYILNVYFTMPIQINSNGLIYIDRIYTSKQYAFIKNLFPYILEKNVQHYIIWYNYIPSNSNVVNTDIYSEIYKILNHSNFQYIWYENPKMNIPDIYHLQVFWIDIT